MQQHSPSDVDQLRAAVFNLAHEMAEAITAMNGYLHAIQHLEGRGDPASLASLHEAIDKATEQAVRARQVVVRLRSIASP